MGALRIKALLGVGCLDRVRRKIGMLQRLSQWRKPLFVQQFFVKDVSIAGLIVRYRTSAAGNVDAINVIKRGINEMDARANHIP